MPRRVIISVVVALVVIITAATIFSTINRIPDAGTGPVNDENVEAGQPEPGAEPTAN